MKFHNKDRMYPAVVHFRELIESDIQELGHICEKDGEPYELWKARISGYLRNEFNPYQALSERVIFVATLSGAPVGFIAGHITKRSDYPGHIQWITVTPHHQRMGLGSELVWIIAGWFADKQIAKVRVDVDVDDAGTQDFFRYHNAQQQNKHWLCWEDIREILPKD